MAAYSYSAFDANGVKKKGYLSAQSEREARKLIKELNLTPLEAAACGTQIVVTRGGSTDDYFDPCLGHQIESTEKKIKTNFSICEPKLDSLVHILENKIQEPSYI